MVGWARARAPAGFHQLRRAYLDPMLYIGNLRPIPMRIARRTLHFVLLVQLLDGVDHAVAIVVLLVVSIKSIDHFFAELLG